MTDLEHFVALYKTFGIDCIVVSIANIAQRNQFGFDRQWRSAENKDGSVILLGASRDYPMTGLVTTASALHGWDGFFSCIEFDGEGKFVRQGFWE